MRIIFLIIWFIISRYLRWRDKGIKSTIKDGAIDLSSKKFNNIQKTKLNIESQLDDRIDENRLDRDAPGVNRNIQKRLDNENKIYNRAYDSLI